MHLAHRGVVLILAQAFRVHPFLSAVKEGTSHAETFVNVDTLQRNDGPPLPPAARLGSATPAQRRSAPFVSPHSRLRGTPPPRTFDSQTLTASSAAVPQSKATASAGASTKTRKARFWGAMKPALIELSGIKASVHLLLVMGVRNSRVADLSTKVRSGEKNPRTFSNTTAKNIGISQMSSTKLR